MAINFFGVCLSLKRESLNGFKTLADELGMNDNNRRYAPRKEIEPLKVSQMNSLHNMVKLAKGGSIIEASSTGFLMHVLRSDLIPMNLKTNLDLSALEGERVLIRLPQMELEITGTIRRTKFMGRAGFELGIDYSDDAPEYWRDCLMDLLPGPGEFDQH